MPEIDFPKKEKTLISKLIIDYKTVIFLIDDPFGRLYLNVKALLGTFDQEKALVGAFSVIVQPVVEPMEHYTALLTSDHRHRNHKQWPESSPGPGPGQSSGVLDQ